MNWIATAFEALKERFEQHKSTTEAGLSSLATRVSGAEEYVKAAVGSAEARLTALEQKQAASS